MVYDHMHMTRILKRTADAMRAGGAAEVVAAYDRLNAIRTNSPKSFWEARNQLFSDFVKLGAATNIIQPDGPANRSQPARRVAMRTFPVAGFRRRPSLCRCSRILRGANRNLLEAEQHTNTMTPELPPAIAAFFQAHNTGQTADFKQLFTDDALVSDESHEYRGAAIKKWIDGAVSKYQPVAAVTDLAEAGAQTIATAQVSGNFPGSPTQLRYNFTLKNGKIAALAIGA